MNIVLLFCLIQLWEVKVQLSANRVTPQVWRTVEHKHKITESQNQCDQIWKGPLAIICSNLATEAGSLTSIAQDHVQRVFEHLHEWRLHNFPGKLCQCWVTVERCSLIFRGNLLSLCFCTLSLILFTTFNYSCIFLHLSHLSRSHESAYLVWWHFPKHLNVTDSEIMFQHGTCVLNWGATWLNQISVKWNWSLFPPACRKTVRRFRAAAEQRTADSFCYVL